MFLRLMVMIYSLACVAYFSTFRAFCIYALFPFAWIMWAWFLNKRPATRVEFQWSSYVFLIMWFVPLVIFYVYVGTHASPEPWGVFNTALSPVGKSPCCRGGASSCNGAPYNPNGYFVYGSQTPRTSQSEPVTFCTVGRWADSNNLAPIAYNQKPGYIDTIGDKCVSGATCDGLATQNPSDYPNLAIGLKDGWVTGALIAPTSLCPGIALLPNAQGYVGKGQEICARCMRNVPAHCKNSAQFFCFMCPGGYYGSEPEPMPYREVRFSAELLFGQFLFMLICTCASIPRCGKGFSAKGYNAFF